MSKLHVVLADIHYPVHNKPAMRAVFQFIKRHSDDIETCVLLGDFLDCENISRHTEGKPRLRKRGGYAADIKGFQEEVLDRLDKLLKKRCRKVAISGNHEQWLQDMLDKQPELEGVIDIPILLNLEDRGWDWIPCGESIQIGKVTLLHGDQIGSGKHVASKLVDLVHGTAVMGHVHRASSHSTAALVTAKSKWCGYTLPCLCTVAPSYAKGQPNAFTNGFGILEQGSSENINVHTVIIMPDGTFNWGGHEYGNGHK